MDHLAAVQQTKLPRRAFLQSLCGLGIGITSMPLLPNLADAQGATEGTLMTWGGFDLEELYAPYVAQHGRFPNHVIFADTDEAMSRLRAGLQVDVAHPCAHDLLRWTDSGLFQPIDPSRLSNWADVIPDLAAQVGNVAGDGRVWFVPLDWGRTSITYRPDLYDPDGRESWDILWDPRLSGKIGMPATGDQAWWAAALQAGVPFAEIDTESGFDAVATALRAQRPLVGLYDDNTANIEQALATGDIAAALTWNSSSVLLQYEGVPVRFADPPQGAVTWVCGLMVHRDAPNLDRAYDIIDALLSAEVGAFLVRTYGYGHSNAKAFLEFSSAELQQIGLGPTPVEALSDARFIIPQTEDWRSRMSGTYERIRADAPESVTAP